MDEEEINMDHLVLIGGLSGAGKSASLRNIKNQEKWVYLGTEAGKKLPFRNKFNTVNITDPLDVIDYFDNCIENPEEVEGIIIDTVSFLMEQFESQYVLTSANTMKAWGDYNQFFKKIMQQKVAKFGKPVIILTHIKEDIDETTAEKTVSAPIKGALRGTGIEAFFSTIVNAKKVSIKELEKYNSDLLEITEEDRALGYKHVFQTRITKSTIGEKIRSPMGMFSISQTYMDNDAQKLLDHLNEFYNS